MTCDAVLYVNGTYPIVVNITEGNLTAADIDQMTITLTNKDSGTPVSFTKVSGKITIIAGVITLLISDTDITVAGWYSLIVTAVDSGGQDYPATPCPAELQFCNQ